jgi:dTDP-4-dehydrorhamnose reductase
MAKKPILVAGRSGQLARCLQDCAVQQNLPMAALGPPDFDLEHLASIEHAVTAIEPCAIINAAAYTAVDQAEAEPERAYAVNRDGAQHLAAAACKKAIPFVHISTDYVFDGRKPSCYQEEDALWSYEARGRNCRAKRQSACGGDPNIVDLQRLRPQFREDDGTFIGDAADCTGCLRSAWDADIGFRSGDRHSGNRAATGFE